jgi:cell division septum initiation protein DivIVA
MKRKIMAEVEVEIDNDQLQEIIKKLEKQVKSLEAKIKRKDREIDELKRKHIVLERMKPSLIIGDDDVR